MAQFEIKITKDPGEIEEAQRLRFQVFNLELKKGLRSSYEHGLDVDEFDAYCDHLIVRDLQSNKIVGTYRLLLGKTARKSIGFYSEHEFDLDRIRRLDGELLEIGRTCSHKEFRDRALIPLMWETIVNYSRRHGVRYIFGCGSLYTTNVVEVSQYFAMLRENYYAPEAFRVQPVPATVFADVDLEPKGWDGPELFQRLPSLIKGYLRSGAWVCGPPALDREFGTTDLFMLLDYSKLKSDYLNRFGLAGLKARNEVG
ncbi:MAG: GNAT family N-acetyltransferase [Deltaproteobacteria bacterium]|nr:GNAT family N-acetyltransferase [Deltaproteobacteria bacterium]